MRWRWGQRGGGDMERTWTSTLNEGEATRDL